MAEKACALPHSIQPSWTLATNAKNTYRDKGIVRTGGSRAATSTTTSTTPFTPHIVDQILSSTLTTRVTDTIALTPFPMSTWVPTLGGAPGEGPDVS